MSTPPAFWINPIDLSNRQRPPSIADDAVRAEKVLRLPNAPLLNLGFPCAPDLVTDRGHDLAQAPTWRENGDDGLERVRAVTSELHNVAGRLPPAAQLGPIPGLPQIGAPGSAVDVPAVPKHVTIKRVPVRLPAPPLRQSREEHGEELSRPAKFLVAAAVCAPLACYVAIAGPYPFFGEAPPPYAPPQAGEVGAADWPFVKLRPWPRGGSSSTLDQSADRSKADTVLASRDAPPPTEAGGRVGQARDRTAPQLPAGGDDVPAIVDNRDPLTIANSGLRYMTRSELEKLSRLAWYRPFDWVAPLKAVEDANTGSTPPVDRLPQNAAPIQKDVRKDFILADSSRQYLTREELQGLSPDQLVIARNEIFARKGRYFKEEALRDHFSQFSWYQPRTWDVPLSPIELANVQLIQAVEQSLAGSRQATSLGRVR